MYFKLFLSYFIGLLAIVDPPAAVPVWLSLTKNYSSTKRREVLGTMITYVFAILILFLFLGNGILQFFNISLHGVRIAGGIMLMINALTFLRSNGKRGYVQDPGEDGPSIAFSPMAMPLLSGPGSIAVIIGISGNIGYVWDSPVKYLVATSAIVAVCAVTYVIFLYSKYLTRVLGPNTLHALELFMGFLLLCMGVQFILDSTLQLLARHGEALCAAASAVPGG
jgi:multiple antibiotic resistance protein